MKSKKTFIYLGLILLLIAGAFLIFYFFFAKKQPEPPARSDFGGFPSASELPPPSPAALEGESPFTGEEQPASLPRFRQLSKEPVAGAGFFKSAEAMAVRWIDRATGNVYEIDPNTLAKKRLSNNTIPKIYEAVWSAGGSNAYLRYLREDNQTDYIETLSLSIPATAATPATLSGIYLERDIDQLAVSPGDNRIFYLKRNGNKEVKGVLADGQGYNQSVIFRHDLVHWLVDWPASNVITLLTKPSSDSLNFLFALNPKTGVLKKILSDFGLTAKLSPDGKKVIFSQNTDGFIGLDFMDLNTRKREEKITFTLSDKCAWGPASDFVICGLSKNIFARKDFPEAWYQGKIAFDDYAFWRYVFKNREEDFIYAPAEFKFDVIEPKISPDGKFLVFINKNDLSLWAVEI
jgi:hypothetical protein